MKNQPIQPRMMTEQEVCEYLRRSDDYLRKIKADHTFPARHPLLKLYDRQEIDEWVDRTAGKAVSYEEILLQRSRAKRENTLPHH